MQGKVHYELFFSACLLLLNTSCKFFNPDTSTKTIVSKNGFLTLKWTSAVILNIDPTAIIPPACQGNAPAVKAETKNQTNTAALPATAADIPPSDATAPQTEFPKQCWYSFTFETLRAKTKKADVVTPETFSSSASDIAEALQYSTLLTEKAVSSLELVEAMRKNPILSQIPTEIDAASSGLQTKVEEVYGQVSNNPIFETFAGSVVSAPLVTQAMQDNVNSATFDKARQQFNKGYWEFLSFVSFRKNKANLVKNPDFEEELRAALEAKHDLQKIADIQTRYEAWKHTKFKDLFITDFPRSKMDKITQTAANLAEKLHTICYTGPRAAQLAQACSGAIGVSVAFAIKRIIEGYVAATNKDQLLVRASEEAQKNFAKFLIDHKQDIVFSAEQMNALVREGRTPKERGLLRNLGLTSAGVSCLKPELAACVQKNALVK